MAYLVAEFEPFRISVGRISLFDKNNILITMLSALGKAAFDTALQHGNPSANPLYLYGDTPTGEYTIMSIAPSGPGTNFPDVKKYGNKGVIILEPKSGDALTAKANGRNGILIHGGSPGPTNLLRRTNGCIRMMNTEIEELISKINEWKNFKQDPTIILRVIEKDLDSSIFADTNDSVNEGDPPF